MKAAFYTLGCKVNQKETAALEEIFRKAGYTVTKADEPADIYIVNSCTVTAGGDAKSRQWLRRARRQNPNAITVLTGCFPQAYPEKAAIPEADVITGNSKRGDILAEIEAFRKSGRQVVSVLPYQKGQAFEELPNSKMQGRTRAFVKVQDGCNRRCAYCIIPSARGQSRSREEGAVIAEVQKLAQQGCAEVVFTGINLSSYGRETGTGLAQLTEAAAKVKGIDRIRLSSLEPDLVTDEDVARFAENDKLCRQFHLSLQSGCGGTLARMRRPYTPQQYMQVAQKLVCAMPGASLTTDVIVGFPGEDEDEFLQSMEFVRQMQFLKVHVFPFSVRPGTPAEGFAGQVTAEEKARRVKRMQEAADKVREEWIAKQEGSEHMVLLETPLENGDFTGYTGNYIPVYISVPHASAGDVVPARLGVFDGQRCAAVLL